MAAYEKAVRDHKRAQKDFNAYVERCRREFWLGLDGHQFESEPADLFRKAGRTISVTPRSGDGGIDLWIESSSLRIPVQCKRLAKPVGVGAVRDFLGAMQDTGASEGILASVSGYTAEAMRLASRNNIELIDLNDILSMQQAH